MSFYAINEFLVAYAFQKTLDYLISYPKICDIWVMPAIKEAVHQGFVWLGGYAPS